MIEKFIIYFALFAFLIQRTDSILTFRRFNIEISNQLGGNNKLMVQCRSGQESTRVVFLAFSDVFKAPLRIGFKTLIWCTLWKGPDFKHHVSFDAFVGKESFIHDVCGSMKPNICFWQVQDDGVWARNNPTGALKLMYKWNI
ncbi:putative plant self-incompatibility S1 [Arabidopsis thaliana]|uniref:S-protein homolog n=1 Tax=Arabidopsis thaliana x Arabidopsis arenosa TaxID=1240361 RepID=A0A8T2DXG1_9BRAS|nr:Plant self-incompatibility S1 [Arabidopsis thaliana x Arabidopsis arenosa]